ncbi:MAG: outer membrane protein assembly factor BamD, partial [Caulobacter sp.]|nr:outer membrane protein assembly factor BamD [Vitreoscilla sp.]
ACASQAEKDAASPVEKLYAEAMDDVESANYDRAIKSLDRIEGKAAGSILAQQAQLELAYLYWKTADKVQALATIDRFIKLHPSSPALDYALYLRGIINFNDDIGWLGSLTGQDLSERDQAAARESYQSFKQLGEQFPDSKYTADARLRMDFTVNMLSRYEVHVAGYYMRRQAYVAAANRAKESVLEFPQTASTPEALSIMVSAYDRLGLTLLRDDAQRVLDKNFPTSAFTVENKNKAWWKLW